MMLSNSFNKSAIGAGLPTAQSQPVYRVPSRTGLRVRATVADETAATQQQQEEERGREIRRSLNKTGRYVRTVKNDPDATKALDADGVGYSLTGLVAQMREEGNFWKQGDVTVKLAKAYGYCWGVERAVRMAYEARRAFPGRSIHVTNEIIHNPEVNRRLREMDVNIVKEDPQKGKDYSKIDNGDVVIFPAFGVGAPDMKYFRDKGVNIVDTTCPWVAKVWNSVDTYAKKKCTSIIHGKYSHEETVATASFAEDYLIIKDLNEAQYVCDYILKGGDREEFMKKFSKAVSKGFDPDVHLNRVGLANQTTMLKGETQAIGKMLERTMMEKFGPQNLQDHFMVMDTICDATQERQDALYEITDDPTIDMMLVVGGFNSSNTSHLQEIPHNKGLPAFWVDTADRIDMASNSIAHKLHYGELKVTENWLPEGPITIGVTSGASTPDRAVEEVLERVFRMKDPNFKGIQPRECAPPVLPTH
uniref:4-hydroxy-3-methylbut-2-enyl diphosphate reductase n=1 Tax=Dunaliella salina TaxID=3046 RepID=C5H8E3_DUNSA|nr:4-hydroxy-3-methylbut-2-enyl diphosphate reductase [Dunaliella salina]